MQALARVLGVDEGRRADAELIRLAQVLESQWRAEGDPSISDDECDRRVTVSGETVDAMLAIRAHSLPALQAKARALLWCWGDVDQWRNNAMREARTTSERAAHAIILDLVDMTAGNHRGHAERPPAGDLVQAAAQFFAARRDRDEASSRLDTASTAASALHPDRPGIIRCLPRGADADHPALADPQRRAAFERWSSQCAAIDSSFGVPGLDEALDRAIEAEDRAAERVVSSRPASVREAVTKYAVMLAAYMAPNGEDIAAAFPFVAFLEDLERLAQA